MVEPTLSRIEAIPGGTRLVRTRFELRIEAGPDRGLRVELPARPFTVGREAGADLVLSDPGTSRRHFEVAPEGDGHRLADLGSKAGTFVEGVRVERARLAPGQRIKAGSTVLVYGTGEEELVAVRSGATELAGLFGASEAMQDLFALVDRFAPLALPVLVQGETGTGKEGLARALHTRSPRAKEPFVVVDGTLLRDPTHARAELFGHERGAFTGADRARPGAFRSASGGTLFLDEVGELPLEVQAHLLRALQEGEVSGLGSDRPVRVEVRVVSATHRDLPAMVAAGSFRQDLWYRLAALPLTVPPLRSRAGDAVLLARRFLPAGVRLAPGAEAALAAHPWPGNVRELKAAVERAGALARGGLVEAGDLGLSGAGGAPGAARAGQEHLAMKQPERELSDAQVLEALARTGGNREAAARLLGVGRSTLFRRLKAMRAGEPEGG